MTVTTCQHLTTITGSKKHYCHTDTGILRKLALPLPQGHSDTGNSERNTLNTTFEKASPPLVTQVILKARSILMSQ